VILEEIIKCRNVNRVVVFPRSSLKIQDDGEILFPIPQDRKITLKDIREYFIKYIYNIFVWVLKQLFKYLLFLLSWFFFFLC